MSEKIDIPVGLHFGMDEADYHSVFALSASGIRNLRISTLDFWTGSALNASRVDEDTKFLRAGRAYDKRVIEGRKAFQDHYAPEFDPAQIDDQFLTTVDDLRAECRQRGLPVSGRKDQIIERLLLNQPSLRDRIYDLAKADYETENAGKEFLSADLISRVEIAAAMIEKHPVLSKAFSGGFPQVSIFWYDKDTGVPCKARIDYLKAKAIIDLKSFGNPLGKPVDVAVRHAIATNMYHVQAAMYWRAVESMCARVAESASSMYKRDDFVTQLAKVDPNERQFAFIFQATGPAPVARGYVMPRGTVFGLGDQIVTWACELFAKCWEKYGADPWVDDTPFQTFDDTQFPAWIGEI